MPEHEAILIIIEILALSDQYAESAWRNIDVWVGISIGLVILAHAAPNQLSRTTTVVLLSLYSAYSYTLMEKTYQLVNSMGGSRIDALRIAEDNGIELNALRPFIVSDGIINIPVFLFFFFGTFLAASGFVIYSHLKLKKG